MNRQPDRSRAFFDGAYDRLKKEGRSGWVGEDDWVFHEKWLYKALNAEYTPKDGTALELGCGAGNWCQVLAASAYTVTGVDFSTSAITWAHQQAIKKGLSIDFLEGDVTDLSELPSESFDFILDGFCYHCLPDEEDRKRYLCNVSRLLSPDGVFYLRAFCTRNPTSGHWSEHMDPDSMIVYEGDRPSKYVGTPDDIERAVTGAGLAIKFSVVSDFVDGMLQLHATRTTK